MPAASSRTAKRRNVKRRPIVKQEIQPGYCSIKSLEKFILFIAVMHVQVGTKITLKRFLEAEDERLKTTDAEFYLARTAAQFLHLLGEEYVATERLIELASSSEDEYQALLREITEQAYKPVLDTVPDLAHASQQALKEAFLKMGEYQPTTLQKMIALFKNLCQQSGIIVNETETSDADIPNEQIDETSPVTQQETSTDTLEKVEGNPLMAEPPSNAQNGSLPTPDFAEAEETGKFMMSLFDLPKKSGWTEEDWTWWQLAVSSKAEKIAQLTKKHGGAKP